MDSLEFTQDKDGHYCLGISCDLSNISDICIVFYYRNYFVWSKLC